MKIQGFLSLSKTSAQFPGNSVKELELKIAAKERSMKIFSEIDHH
jgi:hypothetical protein